MKILLTAIYLVVDCDEEFDEEFDVSAAAASGDYESDAVTELAMSVLQGCMNHYIQYVVLRRFASCNTAGMFSQY